MSSNEMKSPRPLANILELALVAVLVWILLDAIFYTVGRPTAWAVALGLLLVVVRLWFKRQR